MGILSSLGGGQKIITPRDALFRDPNLNKGQAGFGRTSAFGSTGAWKRNESLFVAMWNGCFDRAYLDFCASRLTDFACVFWTDSRLLGVVNRGKDAHLLDNAIKQLELNGNTLPRVVFDDLLEATSLAVNNSQFESGLRNVQDEAAVSAAAACSTLRGKDSLIDRNFQHVQVVVIPCLILLALLGNLLTAKILYRLGRQQLPICLYAAIITGLDLLVLLIKATDLWFQAKTDKSPTMLFLLLHQSLCQVTTFAFSCLVHFHAFVYIALAIDAWRLIRDPKKFSRIHTRAWVRHACLLMLAIVLTLNAQFLWTFAVVRQNSTSNKERGFLCLFADKFSEERFRDYVWPLIDMCAADFLPGGVVAILTVWSFWMLRKVRLPPNQGPTSASQRRKARRLLE